MLPAAGAGSAPSRPVPRPAIPIQAVSRNPSRACPVLVAVAPPDPRPARISSVGSGGSREHCRLRQSAETDQQGVTSIKEPGHQVFDTPAWQIGPWANGLRETLRNDIDSHSYLPQYTAV